MKLEKVKTFVKEHKKELAIGAGCLVVGGVVFFITKKKPKIAGILNTIRSYKLTKFDVTENLVGNGVYEVSSSNPNRYWDVWMENTPLSKLGEIGEGLATISDVDAERGISGVVNVYLKETEN